MNNEPDNNIRPEDIGRYDYYEASDTWTKGYYYISPSEKPKALTDMKDVIYILRKPSLLDKIKNWLVSL